MSIDRLQAHYGFTRMPVSRDIAPQALHPHPAHREAIARIDWCVSQRQPGVITGEVGAGKTVAIRAALGALEPSRHQVIYIPDPTIGMSGIQSHTVTALGGTPAFYSGVLATQTAGLLAGVRAAPRRGLRVMLPYLLPILLILPLIWPGN